MKTITVIGGMYPKKKIEQLEKELDVRIQVHNAIKVKEAELESMIKRTDCTVVVTTFCCHRAMYMVKDISKKNACPTIYPKNTNLRTVVMEGLKMAS